MREYMNAGDAWLSDEEYQFVSSRVPILCVDLLPIVDGGQKFGLILRDIPGGRRGLNLIGGRVLIDEHLHEALERHVQATLGENAELREETLVLVGVYQYFRELTRGALHDPRKNAVSITYAGEVCGTIIPQGEAYGFQTFEIDSPPPGQDFGFGQGSVVYDALKLFRSSPLCMGSRR
ncbi:DUF4916 domain-containing protein [Actinocrispum wychmicini]|uniref:DUF4916 domain-containing protein n=1 Tax=Actinocrispum wychmicini TaxID=1213861 RepID=UPI0010502CB2|nr:DUF4916 domain-containing protein [Actinocrispum wychmicini]